MLVKLFSIEWHAVKVVVFDTILYCITATDGLCSIYQVADGKPLDNYRDITVGTALSKLYYSTAPMAEEFRTSGDCKSSFDKWLLLVNSFLLCSAAALKYNDDTRIAQPCTHI